MRFYYNRFADCEAWRYASPLYDFHVADMIRIRLANAEDADALQRIYAYYVEDSETVVSFETEAPDVAEFRRRIQQISAAFPYLVCEQDGRLLGYAYAHKCFERAAYQWCAETTVYLSRDARGLGIGRALYFALIQLLTKLDYRVLYAVIVSENRDSCLFHDRLGFRLFSVFSQSGWKSGRWLDVSWYELKCGSFDGEPSPPRLITDLSANEIERVCAEATTRVTNSPTLA